ncbi:hypothetical protein SAMN04490239_1290 [Rhodococcus koreensis]|jgi:hypothetical protein|uniref:Uncharacterized protein n=1 Tax=Rhodococcus koreensis TaxID=99653 RepID=A0A1H4LHL0_9NOCA|nr:hypothetical protein SAMN04490239_1290 [Rhodococcus koreensis]
MQWDSLITFVGKLRYQIGAKVPYRTHFCPTGREGFRCRSLLYEKITVYLGEEMTRWGDTDARFAAAVG